MRDILLFSGGMDSVIYKHLFKIKDSACLFVDMGTAENKIEKTLIQQTYPDTICIEVPLKPYELPNYKIPFRNHVLALFAAQYGTRIHFAFTAGDSSKDKDYVFAKHIADSCNYFVSEKDGAVFSEDYEVVLGTKEFTKTQLVQKYIEDDGDIDVLLNSSASCYTGTKNGCGVCRACLRKFVALQNNGISSAHTFVQNPKPLIKELLTEAKIRNRVREIPDIELCLLKINEEFYEK